MENQSVAYELKQVSTRPSNMGLEDLEATCDDASISNCSLSNSPVISNSIDNGNCNNFYADEARAKRKELALARWKANCRNSSLLM